MRTLSNNTNAFVRALAEAKDDITWADDAVQVFQMMKDVLLQCAPLSAGCSHAAQMETKIKELENCMSIDLQRQIAARNGRSPYYLEHLKSHLEKAQPILKGCLAETKGKPIECSNSFQREFNHLLAEFQSTFTEYGFCKIVEPIFEVEEASKRLKVLTMKLADAEKSIDKGDAISGISSLHDVIATQSGMQQAMTEANIARLQVKFGKVREKINELENEFTAKNIRADTDLFMQYLAAHHLLRKTFVTSIYDSDPSYHINCHMIHPGTRGWILERIDRCLKTTDKRLYFVSGKQGSGKTALSSAVCKLYNYDVVASHFFDSSKGQDHSNTVNGLIQSLASDMCKTMPEYLNLLDDKFGNKDLKGYLSRSWKECYNILMKEPFQELYGSGRSASSHLSRKFIIIDGMDECQQSDWGNLQSFLELFLQDMSSIFCILVTARTKFMGNILPKADDDMEGINLEDRAWVNRHIKDIEIYLSTSLGAILSGEDEHETPDRAKADEMTLQTTIDELLKCSAGRFDYAIELMESFAKEMSSSGQFMSSLKKAMAPVRHSHGNEFDERIGDFASPFRAYRDKEGRSVNVRVLRQSHYLMDKSRVALIRGRHKIDLPS